MNTIEYAGVLFSDEMDGMLEIKSASCHKACALLSDVLEIDTFKADLYSDAPLVPFVRNTPLTWYREGQPIGTYYVQDVVRKEANLYHLEATSAIGLLEQDQHLGGIYAGETVAKVVADICTVPYALKTVYQNIKLYGWLPIQTRRANFSQVLFAIGATVKTDYNGLLCIGGLWSEASGEIPDNRVFLGDTVEYASGVTQVSVTEHQYVQTSSETTTLYEGISVQGDVVTFSAPMYGLKATGFTVLSSGANYAVLSAGNGTLTGRAYTHTTREVVKKVANAQVENIVSVKDATLVSAANSVAVATRLVNYYAATQTVEHDIVYDGESPGDVVALNHPFDETPTSGCVESVDFEMDKQLRASQTVLLEYAPPDAGQVEYYDTSEIISKSQTWTVPEGVTSVRAVLIGGGAGGSVGGNGEDGKTRTELATQQTDLGGSGGAGGKGGNGGSGGKVYVADLDTVAGGVATITIGAGGASASAGGNTAIAINGSTATSANGASSATGYTDVLTGKTYGRPGGAGGVGMAGGTGGGTWAVVAAENGQDYTLVANKIFTGGKGGAYADGVTFFDGVNDTVVTGYAQAGGGAGGGAAFGANGANGGDGYAEKNANANGYSAEPGAGGAGATPIAPSDSIVFGSGGTGGYGGGGGGGAGSVGYKRAYGNPKGGYTFGVGGKGGAGGKGGKGAPGCVILSYRVPKTVPNGAVKTKSGDMLKDKYGRQYIV